MIGVTAITAYFLWRTLKSQKDVQDTQNKLYNIERIRLIEQFKPILQYNPFENSFALNAIPRESSRDKEIISIAIQNGSDNQALGVLPLYNEMKGAEIWVNEINPTNLINRRTLISLDFLVPRTAGQPLVYQIYFSVTYSDAAGNKYRQNVYWIQLANLPYVINASIPELIA